MEESGVAAIRQQSHGTVAIEADSNSPAQTSAEFMPVEHVVPSVVPSGRRASEPSDMVATDTNGEYDVLNPRPPTTTPSQPGAEISVNALPAIPLQNAHPVSDPDDSPSSRMTFIRDVPQQPVVGSSPISLRHLRPHGMWKTSLR